MERTLLTITTLFLLALSLPAMAGHHKNIVETASAPEDFGTLVAALKAADLVSTLQVPGLSRYLPPPMPAFSALPIRPVETLLKPENRDKLRAILTYHVVPGQMMASDVVKLNSVKTANGQSVKIAVKNGKVFIDNAQVAKTDIETSNGSFMSSTRSSCPLSKELM